MRQSLPDHEVAIGLPDKPPPMPRSDSECSVASTIFVREDDSVEVRLPLVPQGSKGIVDCSRRARADIKRFMIARTILQESTTKESLTAT